MKFLFFLQPVEKVAIPSGNCCVRENSQLSVTCVINVQEKRSVLSFVSVPGQETSVVLAFSMWP